MAVNISMGAQKTLPPEQEEATGLLDTQIAAEVDELATLSIWAQKLKKDARMVRLAELNEKFKAMANEKNDKNSDDYEKEVVFEGNKFRYKFGEPSTERTVTPEGKEKFANKVGEKAFLEVVSVPLKAIDDYIPKNDQKEYLDYSTGNRTGKIEAKVVNK
jgi:hypothetical protein